MKRSLVFTAIGLIVVPAFASPQLRPVKGMHYATCNTATGELTPTPGPQRYGGVVWSSTYDTGWYFPSYAHGWVVLDWGDCGDPADPCTINGFQFAYATEMMLPDRLDAVIWFFGEENGFNSCARVPLAGFRFIGLPTGGPTWDGWIVTIDLEDSGYEFTIDGSDVDADGLVDFGYTYWFDGPPAGSYTGPLISGDPNGFADAPGQEDAFDAFFLDMADPNEGLPGTCDGTYWFGGHPYGQFWMELYEGTWCSPGCPEPGASGKYCTADVWPNDGDGWWNPWFEGDCRVQLVDLATLLSNYGTTSGATHEQGDVWPENGDGWWEDWNDGDGRIDLEDLAELLSQYGDDCTSDEPDPPMQPVDVSPIP